MWIGSDGFNICNALTFYITHLNNYYLLHGTHCVLMVSISTRQIVKPLVVAYTGQSSQPRNLQRLTALRVTGPRMGLPKQKEQKFDEAMTVLWK